MQLMEAQATFGFTDREKDQYLAGILPAGFFLVGAPSAVIVRFKHPPLLFQCTMKPNVWTQYAVDAALQFAATYNVKTMEHAEIQCHDRCISSPSARALTIWTSLLC